MEVINDLGRDAPVDAGQPQARLVDGWESAFSSRLLAAKSGLLGKVAGCNPLWSIR